MIENKIAEYIDFLAKNNGHSDTFLNEVKLFRSEESLAKHKVMYDNCLIIVGQGCKKLYVKSQEFSYDPNNYLIVPATLPLECETFDTKNEPFLGIIINLDFSILEEISKQIKQEKQLNNSDLIYTSALSDKLEDCVERLLLSLRSQETSNILGLAIIKELYYYLLKDVNSSALHNILNENTNLARIHKALAYINQSIEQELLVSELAKVSGMSVASFHRNFKKVLGQAPLQLIKETKLTKAKGLIINKQYKSTLASIEVGYQSYSQFSREFKRLFGLSPSKIN